MGQGQERAGRSRTRTSRSTRRRRCGRGRSRRSPTSSTRSSTSTSRTTSRRRSPARTPASRAGRSTRSCSTSRRTRPFDLWDRDQRRGVKLYVRRVFIMDDAEQLMPAYLRFVRGVIDSNDLPLNVSREILQESETSRRSAPARVKRVLSLLEELAENDTGQVRHVLEGVRPRAQGRHRRGSRQPRAHREAAALRLDPRRQRGADRVARRLRRRA